MLILKNKSKLQHNKTQNTARTMDCVFVCVYTWLLAMFAQLPALCLQQTACGSCSRGAHPSSCNITVLMTVESRRKAARQ